MTREVIREVIRELKKYTTGKRNTENYDFCPHCGIKNGKCTHYEDE